MSCYNSLSKSGGFVVQMNHHNWFSYEEVYSEVYEQSITLNFFLPCVSLPGIDTSTNYQWK